MGRKAVSVCFKVLLKKLSGQASVMTDVLWTSQTQSMSTNIYMASFIPVLPRPDTYWYLVLSKSVQRALLTSDEGQLPILRSTSVTVCMRCSDRNLQAPLCASDMKLGQHPMAHGTDQALLASMSNYPVTPLYLCQVTWLRTMAGLTPVIFTSSSQNQNKGQC
jgi:hypothetical protein